MVHRLRRKGRPLRVGIKLLQALRKLDWLHNANGSVNFRMLIGLSGYFIMSPVKTSVVANLRESPCFSLGRRLCVFFVTRFSIEIFITDGSISLNKYIIRAYPFGPTEYTTRADPSGATTTTTTTMMPRTRTWPAVGAPSLWRCSWSFWGSWASCASCCSSTRGASYRWPPPTTPSTGSRGPTCASICSPPVSFTVQMRYISLAFRMIWWATHSDQSKWSAVL